jgi:hypothetical protein
LGLFAVEDVKRCQADVRDFLLTESDFVSQFGFRRQMFVVGPSIAAAGDNDNPAVSTVGKALILRLGFIEDCFACGIVRLCGRF